MLPEPGPRIFEGISGKYRQEFGLGFRVLGLGV